MRILTLLFIFTISAISAGAQPALSSESLFNKMITSIKNVRSCTYVLSIDEVVFSKRKESEYLVKLNVKPLQVYIYSIKPNPGAEALYLEQVNTSRILVNPNRFPFVNLNLSVNSMLLRKSHQYNVLQMGFTYLQTILEKNMLLNKRKFFSNITLTEDIEYKNNVYHVLEINNPDFGYQWYTVGKNENVTAIANKFLVNDHMILELNKHVDDYEDVSEGQVIKIPNSFAKKVVLYLDKTNHLPLVQIIYDDKGFYSKIEFSSYIINPTLSNEEFTRDYPKYKF